MKQSQVLVDQGSHVTLLVNNLGSDTNLYWSNVLRLDAANGFE